MAQRFDRQPDIRPYREPEIEPSVPYTYGSWGALAVCYGVNEPFISRIARTVKDEEGYYLWSSPRLVLTLAEAADAFRRGNNEHNGDLIRGAVHWCNERLPAETQLPEDTILRLSWARYGLASITCEENRKYGRFMDVVRHGPDTVILLAPRNPGESDLTPNTRVVPENVIFFATGEPYRQREERPPRREGYGGKNNRRGGFVG
jgi:hypothetical protein